MDISLTTIARELVKLEVLVNGEAVDALASIVHKEDAYIKARLCHQIKGNVPSSCMMWHSSLQPGQGNLAGKR